MQGCFDQLSVALSVPRLRAYDNVLAPTTNLNSVTQYVANMDVAAALTPLLHVFEVTFRNQVHLAMEALYGMQAWYDAPGLLQLTQQKPLQNARLSLRNVRKPESTPRLMAELTLGFWVALFSRGYEQTIWKPHGAALKTIFPHAPRLARTRDAYSQGLQRIRDLRNRVSHWERINNRPHLEKTFQNIAQLVQWLNPAAVELLRQCDRHAHVLSAAGIADSRKGGSVFRLRRDTNMVSGCDVLCCRRFYAAADYIAPLTVFDIGGNKYRLITSTHYNRHKVYVRHVFTHAEYDAGKWKEKQ